MITARCSVSYSPSTLTKLVCLSSLDSERIINHIIAGIGQQEKQSEASMHSGSALIWDDSHGMAY
jgi:hypothetical protein